jgi:hypothetical protein
MRFRQAGDAHPNAGGSGLRPGAKHPAGSRLMGWPRAIPDARPEPQRDRAWSAGGRHALTGRLAASKARVLKAGSATRRSTSLALARGNLAAPGRLTKARARRSFAFAPIPQHSENRRDERRPSISVFRALLRPHPEERATRASRRMGRPRVRSHASRHAPSALSSA